MVVLFVANYHFSSLTRPAQCPNQMPVIDLFTSQRSFFMVHQPDTLRKKVLKSDCWDLTPMFQTTEAWEARFQALEKKLPTYDDFKGTLAQGPDALLACIEFDHSVGREMEFLYTFAHLKNDEDKTQSDNEGLFQRASNLYTRIGEASSFISPEIQAIPSDQLTAYLDKDAFKPYRFYLEQMIRVHSPYQDRRNRTADGNGRRNLKCTPKNFLPAGQCRSQFWYSKESRRRCASPDPWKLYYFPGT